MNSLYFDIKSIYDWYTQGMQSFKINLSTSPKEFELRLKYVSSSLFKQYQYMFSQSSKEIRTYTDKVISYSFKGGNHRQILHSITDVEYQTKEKYDPYDITFVSSIQPYETQQVRFSLSMETGITEKQFMDRIHIGKKIERIRERTTYIYDDFHIDTTVVKQSNRNELEYEVEIEKHKEINTLQDFSTFLKRVFHILYPHLHTLYTPDKYTTTLKLIENKQVPPIFQPVNIQEKHVTPSHPAYIGEELFNYAVTNKLDGVHYKCFFLKGKGFMLLQSGNDLWLEKINKMTTYDAICSCEVTKDNHIHIFEVYQTDMFPTILNEPLTKRIDVCKQIVSDVQTSHITCKPFFTTGDVIKNATHCMQYMAETYGLHDIHGETAVEYYNDGVIFQYNGEYRPSNKKIVPSLKWKFPSKITIDFLAKWNRMIGETVVYQLYSKGNRPGQFILFKTDDGPAELHINKNDVCDGINCDKLGNKVLEIGVHDSQFKLYRVRTDKTEERTNSLFVANETYPQMVNILTLPMLLLMIEDMRNKKLSKSHSASETGDYVMYEEGLFPFKRKHYQEEKMDYIIDTMFHEIQKFNIFDENRIIYSLEFKDKVNHKVYKGIIPGIYVKDQKLKDKMFKYPTENGNYLSLVTKEDDYNTLDILTDYFTEDVRIKGKVKSQQYSPEEYHRLHYKDCIKQLEKANLPITNFNMRECIFEHTKETTLFRITLCKSLLQLISPDRNTKECKWLDISAGWGDRLITAIASDVKKYVAFDPNILLKRGHDDIITRFGNSDFNRFHIYYEPAEVGIPMLPAEETFNLIFSSPPFFDFEVYSGEDTQSISKYSNFDAWLHSFLFQSITSALYRLEPNGHLAIYIVDIGKHSIVEPLFHYIASRHPDMEYVGMIANLPLGKIPKPIWIWKKKGICEVQLERFRRIHNGYKRDLIREFVKQKTVLDLGSGRGGDITKYLQGGAAYVTFVEPNEDNIKECKQRLSKTHLALRSKVIQSTAESYRENKEYDVISSFFTLSFFFSSKQTLTQYIDTIDKHCKLGGIFIGTTILGKPLLSYLKERNGTIVEDCYTVYGLKVDYEAHVTFGQSIEIDLKETKTATRQVEYLVDMDVFISECKKRGFECLRMRQYTKHPELSESENRLSTCYGEFVFKKGTVSQQNFDCIIDAICYAIRSKTIGSDKQHIIDAFSIEYYTHLQHGKLSVTDCISFLKQHKEALKKNFNTIDECITKGEHVNNMDELFALCSNKELVEGCMVYMWEYRKESLKECKYEEWVVEYVCKLLKINCVIIGEQVEFIVDKDAPYVILEKVGDSFLLISEDGKLLH